MFLAFKATQCFIAVFLKASQFFPNLSHINPITVLPFYLFNNNFDIILTPSLWFSSGLRPSGFLGKPLHAFPFSPTHTEPSAHVMHIGRGWREGESNLTPNLKLL